MHYRAIDQRNDKSAKSWQSMQKLQTLFWQSITWAIDYARSRKFCRFYSQVFQAGVSSRGVHVQSDVRFHLSWGLGPKTNVVVIKIILLWGPCRK